MFGNLFIDNQYIYSVIIKFVQEPTPKLEESHFQN